ncbi:hypothetical protein B0H34DRAFT_653729 [Crassisporium funariophilum]|nr:hypothetical protein B0H34DRAFT_653729 [Crassisporium funariophilum]
MTTPPTPSFLSLTRHDKYYISGADLSFLVEHVQFRVHRYFFERESAYFATRLATPASPGTQPQGQGDANAIVLEDITAHEFERFLWVFYNPRYSLYDLAHADDWEVILRLSVLWSFPEVKSLAIRELETKEIADVKRIKLYHENDVDRNLLIPRYASLCEREKPLTLAEGMDLGMETTLMIAAAREQARSSRLPSGARSPLTPTIHGADLHEVIRELFKIVPKEEEASSSVDPQPVVNKSTGGLVTHC